jgi:hypothetical protein
MVTDRPLRTLTARVVSPGVFQLEAGLRLLTNEPGPGPHLLTFPEILLRAGFIPGLEVRFRLEGGQYALSGSGGLRHLSTRIESSGLGLKLGVLGRNKQPTALALLLSLPIATYEGQETSPSFSILIGQKLGRSIRLRFRVRAMTGTVDKSDTVVERPTALVSLGASLRIVGRLDTFLELERVPGAGRVPWGVRQGLPGDAHFRAGIQYRAGSSLALDASLGRSQDRAPSPLLIRLGLTTRYIP